MSRGRGWKKGKTALSHPHQVHRMIGVYCNSSWDAAYCLKMVSYASNKTIDEYLDHPNRHQKWIPEWITACEQEKLERSLLGKKRKLIYTKE